MEFKTVRVEIPEGANIILGQTHFIKTAEDLYEILSGSSPHIKFGVAFTEASGPCLIRHEGNDEGLTRAAVGILQNIGAGHVFAILIKEAFPINVLNSVKMCQEVCRIYCATANPLEVVVAETEQGRGIMGVVDGASPKGIEQDSDKAARKEMLRKFGYKVK
ncbi:MAG TPA: adenosine-specific kinase [Terriglobia bacterium]|nr:adenosine-specific kinase [Terriglobia bacterium]